MIAPVAIGGPCIRLYHKGLKAREVKETANAGTRLADLPGRAKWPRGAQRGIFLVEQ